jgi:pSer/pThr/pTyr-binding forkhead associated (FHA) protein
MVHSLSKLMMMLPDREEVEFLLEKTSITLGRATINEIVLHDTKVSRHHARIERGETGFTLMDLGSTNGTFLNGRRATSSVLTPGDVLQLGDTLFRFESGLPLMEPDIIPLNSEADLEKTLCRTTLSMTLSNTDVPRLSIHTSDKTWEVLMSKEALTIGRHPQSDIVLDQPMVSRNHARIERLGETFVIRDLGSTNGTWISGQRIEKHTLQDCDAVLIGKARLLFKHRFSSEDLTLTGLPKRPKKLKRQPVIFIPGLLGSELWRGSERIWPNPRILFTQTQPLRISEDNPLEARAVVGEVVIVPNLIKLERYSGLTDYLEEGLGYERGKDLFEFPYDWRLDCRLAARQLAKAIDAWKVVPPVIIIAHSMGSLVSRYYVECLGGKKKVSRIIFLGGPHYGAPKALMTLLFGPKLLPFGLLGERLREVISTFPSMYQILPTYPSCTVDKNNKAIHLLSDETWLLDGQKPLLRNARQFRSELGTHCSIPSVSIFGYGIKTITKAKVYRDSLGRWQNVEFDSEEGGDATVPEQSAVVEGSEIHPVQQSHGTIFADRDVKKRLKVELTRP